MAKRSTTPKDPTAPKPIPAPVKQCMDAFYAGYVRKWNPKPLADAWLADMALGIAPSNRSVAKEELMLPLLQAKDGAHFKQLVAAWGEQTVLKLIDLFFETTMPRVVSSDYTVGAFFNVAPGLQLRLRNIAQPDRRMAEAIDAAARATGRR